MTDRFISPCPPPTPHERELLTVTVEEIGEVLQEALHVHQRATKALRFGLDEVQPGQPDSNRRRLGLEIGGLFECVRRLLDVGVVDADDVREGERRKRTQLARFMQTGPGS